MEKLKDFLYEKSDLFFAGIVVICVSIVVLYSLNGWLIVDSQSKYAEIPSHETAPADTENKNQTDITIGENSNSTKETPTNGTVDNPTTTAQPSASDNTKTPAESGSNNNSVSPANNGSEQNQAVNGNNSQTNNNSTKPATNNANADNTKPAENNGTGNATDNKQPVANNNAGSNTKPATNNNAGTNNKPATNNQTAQKKSTTITIKPGSSAGSIAGQLQNKGLISDTNSFINSIVSSGKEKRLQAGTFTIPANATQSQIINILTS